MERHELSSNLSTWIYWWQAMGKLFLSFILVMVRNYVISFINLLVALLFLRPWCSHLLTAPAPAMFFSTPTSQNDLHPLAQAIEKAFLQLPSWLNSTSVGSDEGACCHHPAEALKESLPKQVYCTEFICSNQKRCRLVRAESHPLNVLSVWTETSSDRRHSCPVCWYRAQTSQKKLETSSFLKAYHLPPADLMQILSDVRIIYILAIPAGNKQVLTERRGCTRSGGYCACLRRSHPKNSSRADMAPYSSLRFTERKCAHVCSTTLLTPPLAALHQCLWTQTSLGLCLCTREVEQPQASLRALLAVHGKCNTLCCLKGLNTSTYPVYKLCFSKKLSENSEFNPTEGMGGHFGQY
ncbi:hypothetical protein EK904_002593 [Melospiza melodia maxima]|nr:hypothetical protein EK904_002593 [Melospiza melodia maxima]